MELLSKFTENIRTINTFGDEHLLVLTLKSLLTLNSKNTLLFQDLVLLEKMTEKEAKKWASSKGDGLTRIGYMLFEIFNKMKNSEEKKNLLSYIKEISRDCHQTTSTALCTQSGTSSTLPTHVPRDLTNIMSDFLYGESKDKKSGSHEPDGNLEEKEVKGD